MSPRGGLSADAEAKRRQLDALAKNNPGLKARLEAGHHDSPADAPTPGKDAALPGNEPTPGFHLEDSVLTPNEPLTVGGIPVVGAQEPTHAATPELVEVQRDDAGPEPSGFDPDPDVAAAARATRRRGFLDGLRDGLADL